MWSRILPTGTPIRVVQSIQTGTSTWKTEVTGVVESWAYEETGAWYAHGKLGKLWLPRIRIRKPDGELTVVTLDPMTEVEPLAPAEWIGMPPSPVNASPKRETWSSIVAREGHRPLPGAVYPDPSGNPRNVAGEAGPENAPAHTEGGCHRASRKIMWARRPLSAKPTQETARLADALR
jgi:hypothetical protein